MAGRAIEAQAIVHASREAIFDYLARLDHHWRLMDDSVEVLSLDGDGDEGPDRAAVRMHGPLGVGRTAHTRVLEARRPALLCGRAAIGRKLDGGRTTEAEVRWTLEAQGEATRVLLAATVKQAGMGDRLLLALGGRVWMRARFRGALARLDGLLREDGG
jgi:hypothetical protein